jgi:hypothetical protein
MNKVICSELPNNPSGSIINSAEVIAAGVIGANELPTPLVWIEHCPMRRSSSDSPNPEVARAMPGLYGADRQLL